MRSEQARQLRRQRKRLKREERRRNHRVEPGDAFAWFDPELAVRLLLRELPPMGETLMAYSEPFINCMFGPDLEPEQLRAVLLLTSLFWNVATNDGDCDRVVSLTAPLLVKKLQMTTEEAVRTAKTLITAKLEYFPCDPRTIEDVAVSHDGDRIRVTARSTVRREDLARLVARFEQ